MYEVAFFASIVNNLHMNLPIFIAAAIFLGGCATGKAYQTQSGLMSDPGSRVELRATHSVGKVYGVVLEMMRTCIDGRSVRTEGTPPDSTGKVGTITTRVSSAFGPSTVLTVTTLESTGNGTRIVIYGASEAAPENQVRMYRRWLDDGKLTCSE